MVYSAQADTTDAAVPPGVYCEDVCRTIRRKTRTVWVGKVPIGSEHPIARQTMTTTDTKDVEASVAQIKKCADNGADLIRLTVQGKKEADACMAIRNRLWEDGYDIPLVADIHFAPKIAMKVCEAFEKIRVNPGNFADGIKSFEEKNYEDESEYQYVVLCSVFGFVWFCCPSLFVSSSLCCFPLFRFFSCTPLYSCDCITDKFKLPRRNITCSRDNFWRVVLMSRETQG